MLRTLARLERICRDRECSAIAAARIDASVPPRRVIAHRSSNAWDVFWTGWPNEVRDRLTCKRFPGSLAPHDNREKAMAPALSRQAECRLDQSAVSALRKSLRGPLLQPSDDGVRRGTLNLERHDRQAAGADRPGQRCRNVITCVRFARDNGLPLSIRGGGHNVAGTALCEGGLMIDMSLRRGVRLDAARRTRSRRSRRHLGQRRSRDAAIRPRRYRAASCRIPASPASPWAAVSAGPRANSGYAADNLVSVDIVTADGELKVAQRDGKHRSVLGFAWRRRQLRRRHVIRVQCAPHGPPRYAAW